MQIKSFFFILVALLLALVGCLFYFSEFISSTFFYLSGGILCLIFCYLIFFYRKIIKPLRTIANGMELLNEQDFSSRLAPVGQYDADLLVALFNRMMEQLKNERLRLREQNQFLDLLIQASPMGVIITTFEGEISQLNPMAVKMLGVSEEKSLQRPLSSLDTPLAVDVAALKRGETKVIRLNDAQIYKCTCSSFVTHGFSHPFYLIERMTEELMRAEKKAYEKVIRMIAHEVNNTTAGITSTLDTAEQAMREEEGTDDLCDMMRVCIERCFSMSNFITRFADVVKIPEPVKAPTSLNELAETCKRFMEGMCNNRNIVLRLDCDEEVEEVNLDASLFEQVMLNIIKNAAESIEQDGEIVIRTIAPASIEVVDNGPGISKETATKLFTPFFSTKPSGQGIGLIFIREVLSRHGCTFSLQTYKDGLTHFKIVF